NDPAPTHIYPLSLHDALPIYSNARDGRPRMHPAPEAHYGAIEDYHRNWTLGRQHHEQGFAGGCRRLPNKTNRRDTAPGDAQTDRDRKSTRLNSSHVENSYAVF